MSDIDPADLAVAADGEAHRPGIDGIHDPGTTRCGLPVADFPRRLDVDTVDRGDRCQVCWGAGSRRERDEAQVDHEAGHPNGFEWCPFCERKGR